MVVLFLKQGTSSALSVVINLQPSSSPHEEVWCCGLLTSLGDRVGDRHSFALHLDSEVNSNGELLFPFCASVKEELDCDREENVYDYGEFLYPLPNYFRS